MFKWKLYLPALYIAIVPLIFGYLGKPTEMGLAAITSCLLFVFLNLEQFQSFKGAGFEATMREVDKVVNEAYATIEKLQDVAAALAEPIVVSITMEGRMLERIRKESKVELIQEIEKSLIGVGVSTDKVANVTKTFYSAVKDDYTRGILSQITQDEDAPEPLKLSAKMLNEDLPDDFDIVQYLAESNWQPSDKIAELLKDLKFFKEQHKYRTNQ